MGLAVLIVLISAAAVGFSLYHKEADGGDGTAKPAVDLKDRGNIGSPTENGKTRVVTVKFKTDDVVIANYLVTDFGAKGDGETDATDAFQSALNAAHKDGGGVVFAPSGRYAIREHLTIPEGVTLRGDWRKPEELADGTILLAFADKGKSEGKPFITMLPSTGLTNLSVWYPEQDYRNIQPYPWTIKQDHGHSITVENVTLYNSYQGIRMGLEPNQQHLLRNVYGTPLKTGIFRDNVLDVGRMQNISFGPQFWVQSGLPGAPAAKEAEAQLCGWMAQNGTGIVMAFHAWLFIYGITLENYHIGMHFIPSIKSPGERGPHGSLTQLHISGGETGLLVEDTSVNGLMIADSEIGASAGTDPVAIATTDDFASLIQLNRVTVGGAPHTAIRLKGDGIFQAVNSTFKDWGYHGGTYAVDVQSGSVDIVQSRFEQDKGHILLGAATKTAAILADTFAGGKQIQNHAPVGAQVEIVDEVTMDGKPYRFPEMNAKPYPFRTPPRPKSDLLYNVTDFGAKGNGTNDDFAAIQAALDAAGKTGGTVYLPAGKYRLSSGGLTVPSGVELRGSADVQEHTQDTQGTQLFAYAGKDSPDGTPLIKLGANSGIRGLMVYYPEQVLKTKKFIPYPWTVQGQGAGVWARDVVLINSYQGIDFGTHDSTGHYVDYVSGCPLSKGLFLGSNSGEGWVQNVQFIPHYWRLSAYGDPKEKTLQNQSLKSMDALILGYNANEHVLHTFTFGAHMGIHFIKQPGLGVTSGTVNSHGTDGSEIGMQIDDIGNVEFVNTMLVAKTSQNKKMHLVVSKEATGTAKFFNLQVWGSKTDRSIQLEGGNVVLQGANFVQQGDAGLYAAGGKVEMTNSYFQRWNLPRLIYVGPDVTKAVLIDNMRAVNDSKPQALPYVIEDDVHTSIEYMFDRPFDKSKDEAEESADDEQ
jgi:hypothetical protein